VAIPVAVTAAEEVAAIPVVATAAEVAVEAEVAAIPVVVTAAEVEAIPVAVTAAEVVVMAAEVEVAIPVVVMAAEVVVAIPVAVMAAEVVVAIPVAVMAAEVVAIPVAVMAAEVEVEVAIPAAVMAVAEAPRDDGDDEIDPDYVVNPSTSSGTALTIATINKLGLPVILQYEDGAWAFCNLGALTNNATLLSSIMTWTDPRDDASHAAIATSAGLLVFRRGSSGAWTVTNLTNMVSGSEKIDGPLTQFISTNGVVFLAGMTADGDLVYYAKSTIGYWSYRNLSEHDLEPQGMSTPQFVGEIVGFVTSWNALNIAGLDENGQIRAFWFAQGMSLWREDNLSALTGAPALHGGLTPFLTSWGAINLAGVDGGGNLLATWWVPRRRLADQRPDFARRRPQAARRHRQQLRHAVGRDECRGRRRAWPPERLLVGTGHGSVVDRSPQQRGRRCARPCRPPSAASPPGNAEINLIGASETGDLIRYFWSPGQTWDMENLSEAV
jgi:hypothetical protein